ncbi:MAG: TetR/AcrR family transcriptional regulator [Ignavibacteriales bacterium]
MEKPKFAPTKKGILAKEKIRAAALFLINEKGYAETTLVDICQAAGIANGTFYHYFKSKQDILLDYIKQESADLTDYYAALNKDSYAHALQSVLDFQAEYYIRKGTEFVSNFYSIMLLSKDNFFRYEDFSLTGIIYDCLEKGQTSGEFTSSYPVTFMQDLTIGMLYSMTTIWCIAQGSLDLKSEMHDKFENLISMFRR